MPRAFPQSRTTGISPTPSSAVVLAIVLTCQLMLVLDVSVVITALPKIQSALGFSTGGLSWVQNAYTLAFGGLLLLGARAGDILGRRRVFVAGIALFTAASLLGGLAQSELWLLTARAVQGIGAAIAAPSTLALLTLTFREGRERTRALSLYSAVSGGGGSVGLVLGGMLTTWASWRWGLLVNVPIGVALIALAPRFLPETERRTGHFDLAGALTSTLGMTSLVYGFVRAAANGWSDRGTIGSFAAAALLLAVFVLVERRAEQPITPLRLFTSRERSGAYIARILVIGGVFGMFFFVTQFFQDVEHYSALQAGLAFLPQTVLLFAMLLVVPRIVARVGTTWLLAGGLVTALAGMAWLSRLSAGAHYFPHVAVPLAIIGVGVGAAFIPLTAAGLAGVAGNDAGAASGLVNAAQQLGGSVGIGVLISVFASASGTHAQRHLAAATQRTNDLANSIGAPLTASVVFIALGLAVVLLVMRRPPQSAEVARIPERRMAEAREAA
jgi:EmrB/QacA subfamily drug resistance transporter